MTLLSPLYLHDSQKSNGRVTTIVAEASLYTCWKSVSCHSAKKAPRRAITELRHPAWPTRLQQRSWLLQQWLVATLSLLFLWSFWRNGNELFIASIMACPVCFSFISCHSINALSGVILAEWRQVISYFCKRTSLCFSNGSCLSVISLFGGSVWSSGNSSFQKNRNLLVPSLVALMPTFSGVKSLTTGPWFRPWYGTMIPMLSRSILSPWRRSHRGTICWRPAPLSPTTSVTGKYISLG